METSRSPGEVVEVYFPHDQKWHKGKVIGGGRGAPYLVEFIDGRADIAPDRINDPCADASWNGRKERRRLGALSNAPPGAAARIVRLRASRAEAVAEAARREAEAVRQSAEAAAETARREAEPRWTATSSAGSAPKHRTAVFRGKYDRGVSWVFCGELSKWRH